MSQTSSSKGSPWYITVLIIGALILLSPFILIGVMLFMVPWLHKRFFQRPRLLRRVKNEWLPQNKHILFVYSDNPLWKEYAEKNIIPKIAQHAIVLNWSERRNWIHSDSLEAQLFRNFQWGHKRMWRPGARAGGHDFNHMAIVFNPVQKPKTISFWEAFKDYKFGNNKTLDLTEKELYDYLC
jgi:hypothetical protein